MKNVLFIEPTIRPVGVDYLIERFNVFLTNDSTEENLIKVINEKEINGLITRTEIINSNILESCPTLEVIGQHGIGVNNIDIASATKNRINVVNVPDATIISVAEHTLMSILSLSKNLKRNDKEVRRNNWKYREEVLPSEIHNKNLFVIGYGNIGKKVVEYAKIFGMHIYIYDPYATTNIDGATFVVDIEYGLKKADYITLHIPLLESTKKLISKKEFEIMKPSAYLINVSRGEVVDQKELIHALQRNRIAGAQLDVLETEPPHFSDSILSLDNIILTPHIAGDTKEAKDRCSKILAKEVSLVLNGKKSENILNKIL